MKSLAFLFSFYFLTLNFLPCGDIDECSIQEKQEVSASLAGDEYEPENCNPFCSCACCASVAFYLGFNSSKQILFSAVQLKLFSLDDDFKSHNARAVWQPPRV
jgi:hypothetical protein